jgi:capsular exopolysaccharide synthesis family protein
VLDRNERNLPWRGPQGGALAPGDIGAWNGYPMPSEDEPGESFDPVKLFWIAVRYRWLIAIILAVSIVLGVVTTMMQSPKYAASARIEVMVPTARILEEMDVVGPPTDMRTIETAKEKLKSRDLARRVVLELNLANNAGFLFPLPDFSFANILARVFGTPPRPSLEQHELADREHLAINILLANLSATLQRGTSLIEVRYADGNPALAHAVANQVVRSYMDQQVDRTIETSELARQFIDEQVAETKRQLEEAEAALVAYVKEQQLSGGGDDGSLISASITAINEALGKAVQARLENERLLAQIDAGRAAQLKAVLDNEAIGATRAKLGELRARYEQDLFVYKADFPAMRQLAGQIAEVEQQLADEIDVIVGSIRLAYEASLQEEADLAKKLGELEAEQVAFRDKNIQYTILKREAESYRTQYESLVSKRNEIGVVSDLRRANVEVVDFAVEPVSPFEPSLMRSLLMFVGAALALSVAVIYVLELLNNKFSVPEQVESELRLPVLGIIPKAEGSKLTEALNNSRSAISEAYRSLRTSLQFAGTDGAPRSLLITSSEPGETKSTTAQKLAEEFAAIGNRVLIIDCDLRRPSLHRMFKVDNTMGLSNLLTNTVAQEDIQRLFHHSITHPNLSFLATGPMVPNPADLLSSPRMGAILHACMKTYAIVIMDGPPVIGISDALILSRLAESTLLVVAAHRTARKSARATLKRLQTAGGHMVGAMLGMLDVEKIEYSYSYRYMYEGYYAYGAEEGTPALEERKGGEHKTGERDAQGSVVGRFYRKHLRPMLERG